MQLLVMRNQPLMFFRLMLRCARRAVELIPTNAVSLSWMPYCLRFCSRSVSDSPPQIPCVSWRRENSKHFSTTEHSRQMALALREFSFAVRDASSGNHQLVGLPTHAPDFISNRNSISDKCPPFRCQTIQAGLPIIKLPLLVYPLLGHAVRTNLVWFYERGLVCQ